MISQFQQFMALETEKKILHVDTVNAGVRRLMDSPELGFFLVAELDGQLAGSLMVTFEWSDWRNGLFLWVQSVYVMPEFRRRGIYAQLYLWLKQHAAEDEDIIGVRLYVDTDNAGAQKAYKSLGMYECHYQMFEELL
ncbi:GNAT family N-acetyltransferase [bacterium]|nr:GNAT family N-acetyltransferase [bacterium]